MIWFSGSALVGYISILMMFTRRVGNQFRFDYAHFPIWMFCLNFLHHPFLCSHESHQSRLTSWPLQRHATLLPPGSPHFLNYCQDLYFLTRFKLIVCGIRHNATIPILRLMLYFKIHHDFDFELPLTSVGLKHIFVFIFK